MPKYLKVADSDVVTVSPENIERKEGTNMPEEKLFDIIEKIGLIEKQRVQDLHSSQDAMNQMLRTVTALGESFKEQTGKLEGKVSRSEINDLMAECLRDPGGEACRLIEAQTAKSAEVVAKEAGKPAGEPTISLSHGSWEEAMACEKCGPSFAHMVGKRKELLQEAIAVANKEDLRAVVDGQLAPEGQKTEGGF